jgi:photosystem II stability/assembly factor-like uncharacterized protein
MRKLLIPFIVLVLAVPAFGQWRRANLHGADVRALIIDPANPDHLFLGTSSGEVYVSTDGAHSWRAPRNGIPFPGHIVDNLVLDRSGRLWAACWGLWGGGVIAVSDDGGVTWARRDAGLEDFSVRAIAVDPHDKDFVVVGGLTGVYRSTDSGESWTKISDQINVESLAVDPRSRDRIYVGTWRQGIRTEDGGGSWKLINNGMVLDTDMFSITVDDRNPDNVWVSTCGWVYNTRNRGDNWTRFRDGFNNRRVHDIELDPCDRDSLFAGTVAGLYHSHDGGKTWYLVSDESLVVNTIALDPQRPNRVILGVEGDGVYVSDNGAKSFTRACNGLHNLTITAMASDPVKARRVYAAVGFGGTSNGIYQSDDAGATWIKLATKDMPPVLSLVVNADSDPKFVAGTERGFFTSNDGSEWVQSAPVNAPLRADKVLRFNKTRYFAATSEGVFTSRDAATSWYRLADADNKTVDIAIGSLGDKRALFALTSSGVQVFDGAQWAGVSGAPAKGRTIAVSGSGDQQFVFIAGSHGVHAGHVNAMRNWDETDVPDAQFAAVFGGSRSADDFVFLTSRQQREVLVADPKRGGWQSIPLPSRTAEVTSIALDPFDARRLYVGTLGEGVFVFEGTSSKYEVKKKPEATAAALAAGTTAQ